MSDSLNEKDNNKYEPTEEVKAEESTIFSAPVAHKESKKGSNMLRNATFAIVLLLCVACLATSLWIFVPKMEDDSNSSNAEIDTTPLWSLKATELESVTITKDKDKIEFVAVEKEGATSSGASSREWHIKRLDNTLISMDKTQSAVSTITLLEYLKEMEKTDADYGFDSRLFTIDVKNKEASKSKTLIVGAMTADARNVYIKTTDTDKVYLAETRAFEGLSVNALDFADTTGLPAFSKESDYNGEYFSDGAITGFEKIIVEGTALSEKLVFEQNKGVLDFGSYVITSPSHRYANTENVSGLYNVFRVGLAGSGVYSFSNTEAEQRIYGLDKPDFAATIYAGDDSRGFKVKMQTDGSYALVGDGLKVILKVSADSLAFATYNVNDFYSNFMFIESLTEAKTITITEGNKSHKFDIITEQVENAEGEKENKINSIKANGKVIDTKKFQDYYEHLLWISAVEFNFIDTSNREADLTIHITHNDGTKDTVIKYYQKSDMRYQLEVNEEKMGVISSSNFKNIFSYAENVANNKNYSS